MQDMQKQCLTHAVLKILLWSGLCEHSFPVFLKSYNASFCCLSQQSSKGDYRWHAGTVEEQERCHTLEAQTVLKITEIEGSLPFDVQDQATEQPEERGGLLRLREWPKLSWLHLQPQDMFCARLPSCYCTRCHLFIWSQLLDSNLRFGQLTNIVLSTNINRCPRLWSFTSET